MSDLESKIQQAVKDVEELVEGIFAEKFKDAPKPPPIDSFKASAMSEIGRKITRRAFKIEEDWAHFTRS